MSLRLQLLEGILKLFHLHGLEVIEEWVDSGTNVLVKNECQLRPFGTNSLIGVTKYLGESFQNRGRGSYGCAKRPGIMQIQSCHSTSKHAKIVRT